MTTTSNLTSNVFDEHYHQMGKTRDQLLIDVLNLKMNKDPNKQTLIIEINQWEKNSIEKIHETAQQCRDQWVNYFDGFLLGFEKKFNHLNQQTNEVQIEYQSDVKELKSKLEELKEELHRFKDVSIEHQSTPLISRIYVPIPRDRDIPWKPSATTIVGGNLGDRLDRLSSPHGFCLDENDQAIYIADTDNNRIIKWRFNERSGRVVAGGNGRGNRTNQLNEPTDVAIDRDNNALIIADHGNRRVLRWSLDDGTRGQVIISDIGCVGVKMHPDGTLYVGDCQNHEVIRMERGTNRRTVAAGGNGRGHRRNQLHAPTYLFVDLDHTVYVSDTKNHRVMKWSQNSTEGTIVAGGNDEGGDLRQLSLPVGVLVDHLGRVYVTDHGNGRVMRWCEGANEGTVVAGGNGQGQQANQLRNPEGLCFDGQGNLYVADCRNGRIQKFDIN